MNKQNWHMVLVAVLAAVFTSAFAVPQASAKEPTDRASVSVDASNTQQVANLQATGGKCEQLAKAYDACEAGRKDCNDKLAEANTDLTHVVDQCYGMTVEEYRKQKECGTPPKPKKPGLYVEICVSPATKAGNTCACPSGPEYKLGGEDPVAVFTTPDKGKPWQRRVTCTYTSTAIKAHAELVDTQFNNMCGELDSLPTAEQVAASEMPATAEPKTKCQQTSRHVASLYRWSMELRSNDNGVPGLVRESWEEIWRRVSDASNGLAILCDRQDDESLTEACARTRADWDEWRAQKDAKDEEQDWRLDDVEHRLDAIGQSRWLIGGDVSYVYRMGKVPDSTSVAAVVGWSHKFSKVAGFSASFLPGVALSEWSNRFYAGGQFAAHFSASDYVAIMLAARASAEIIGFGNDAGNGLAIIGLDIRPVPEFMILPYLGGGGSFVKLYDEDGNRGNNALGTSLTFGLTLAWATSSDPGKKSPPPPSEPATVTTTGRASSLGARF